MFLFHLTPEDILYLFSGAVALLATAPGIAVVVLVVGFGVAMYMRRNRTNK